MKIIAVDDEKLALDTLVDSIEKAVPDASITGFESLMMLCNLSAKMIARSPFWI